jgi:hypothetical protein
MLTLKKKKLISSSMALLLSSFVNLSIAGETTLVSVNNKSIQGNSRSTLSKISADGRIVSFCSHANNLVSNDDNGETDVFVKDRLTGQTSRVSVHSRGLQGNNESCSIVLSQDGRYVAFQSSATNLVDGDKNASADAFVHDRKTHETIRVSVSSKGIEGNDWSTPVAISADGRYVLLDSIATNLVVGDANGSPDAFIHDRITGKTTRASLSSEGLEGNGYSVPTGMSSDGRFVAFYSNATNIVKEKYPDAGADNAYVRDRSTGKTIRVNIPLKDVPLTNHDSDSYSGAISADGHYITFQSDANNLVSGDTNNAPDAFVYDRLTGKIRRVSISSLGEQGNNYSIPVGISADGRYVVFNSDATNLIVGDADANEAMDAFVHDLKNGKTERVSVNSEGNEGYGWSFANDVSSDGRYVIFQSTAREFSVGDVNDDFDVFVRDRLLDKNHHSDLKINVVQQPWTLAKNSYGAYNFKITNNGPDPINNVSVTHLVSNGPKLLGILSSQGVCSHYAIISLCQFGKLMPGNSLSLFSIAKSDDRNPLIQRVTVSGQPLDATPSNNRAFVSTKVAP